MTHFDDVNLILHFLELFEYLKFIFSTLSKFCHILCVFFFTVLDFRTLEIRLWYYKVKTFSPCLQSYSLLFFLIEYLIQNLGFFRTR